MLVYAKQNDLFFKLIIDSRHSKIEGEYYLGKRPKEMTAQQAVYKHERSNRQLIPVAQFLYGYQKDNVWYWHDGSTG